MKTTIQLNGEDINIYLKFQHRQFSHIEKMDKTVTITYPLYKGITECYIEKEEDYSILAIGHSSCTPNDCFCKETGRKIALIRAVKDLPKSERKKIWECYLNRQVK